MIIVKSVTVHSNQGTNDITAVPAGLMGASTGIMLGRLLPSAGGAANGGRP
jgi:hypothetical protein